MLGTRIVVRAIVHVLPQLLHVVGINNLGIGEVHGNLKRHTQLINRDVGIGRDDRPGRKVDTLAHQVATDASLFALEPLDERTDGTTGTLKSGVDTGTGIVNQGRHIVLQHHAEDVNVLLDTLFDAQLELVVGLDQDGQLVSQIILGPLSSVIPNAGAHSGRGNRHDGTNQIFRPVVLLVEPEDLSITVRNATKDTQHVLGIENLLLDLDVRRHLLPLHGQLQDALL